MITNTTKPVANTPWRVVTASDYSGIAIEDSQGALLLEMEWDDTEPFESDIHDDTKANAELIVRAVNSHAALVNCVKLALHRLDHRGTLADVGVDRQQYENAIALAKEQS